MPDSAVTIIERETSAVAVEVTEGASVAVVARTASAAPVVRSARATAVANAASVGVTAPAPVQVSASSGPRGPAGPAGAQGVQGIQGIQGVQGPAGPGVAAGGATGQFLRKAGNDNYDTDWGLPTKADVGLANVDNTADVNKPVSTAQAAALALKQDLDEKGVANGYAGLDGSAKVPTSQLPDAVLGALSYQGAWNADANDPVLPAAAPENKGHYRIVNTSGSTNVDGISDWKVGDWIISNGTTYDKIDNTDAVSSVAGLTGAISTPSLRTALFIDNVENTADLDKPVSTLTQTAIDNVADDLAAHATSTNNPHAVTKAQVGLSNADNTSDLNKPVSTLQQAALDLKQSLSAKSQANGYASLDATAKIPLAEIPSALIGAANYQGSWNAATNVPAIPTASAANKGHYYIVGNPGSTTINGISDWKLGDWIISNGTVWDKVDNTDAVISVAGLIGIITASALKAALGITVADVSGAAPLDSPAFTGAPTAPDPDPGDASQRIATTQWMLDNFFGLQSFFTPLMDGTASIGNASADGYSAASHRHPTDTTRLPVASPVFTGNMRGPSAHTYSFGSSFNTVMIGDDAASTIRFAVGGSSRMTIESTRIKVHGGHVSFPDAMGLRWGDAGDVNIVGDLASGLSFTVGGVIRAGFDATGVWRLLGPYDGRPAEFYQYWGNGTLAVYGNEGTNTYAVIVNGQTRLQISPGGNTLVGAALSLSEDAYIYFGDGSVGINGDSSGDQLIFHTAGVSRVTIGATGAISFTASPYMVQPDGAYHYWGSGSVGIYGDSITNSFNVFTNGSTRFLINSAGGVGFPAYGEGVATTNSSGTLVVRSDPIITTQPYGTISAQAASMRALMDNGSWLPNQLPDSGRFTGYNQNAALQPPAYAAPGYLTPYNEGTINSYAKFIHDNSTHGGTGAALNTDVKELIELILYPSTPTPYGPEFWVIKLVAPTTLLETFTFGGDTYGMQWTNLFTAMPRKYTASCYIKVKSGKVFLQQDGSNARLFFSGVENLSTGSQNVRQLADGWNQVSWMKTAPLYRYDYKAWFFACTAGAEVLFALPALYPGWRLTDSNTGLSPNNEFFGEG